MESVALTSTFNIWHPSYYLLNASWLLFFTELAEAAHHALQLVLRLELANLEPVLFEPAHMLRNLNQEVVLCEQKLLLIHPDDWLLQLLFESSWVSIEHL